VPGVLVNRQRHQPVRRLAGRDASDLAASSARSKASEDRVPEVGGDLDVAQLGARRNDYPVWWSHRRP
jgi:5'-3' exonuclease